MTQIHTNLSLKRGWLISERSGSLGADLLLFPVVSLFSESATMSLCSRWVTQYLSLLSQSMLYAHVSFAWVTTWGSVTYTFYSCNASGNKQKQRLISRECKQDYSLKGNGLWLRVICSQRLLFPFPACFMFKYCLYGKKPVIFWVCMHYFLSRGDSNMISRNHEWLIWVLLVTKTSVRFLFLISTFDCGYSRRFCFLHFNTLGGYLFSPDCVQSSVLDTEEGGY